MIVIYIISKLLDLLKINLYIKCNVICFLLSGLVGILWIVFLKFVTIPLVSRPQQTLNADDSDPSSDSKPQEKIKIPWWTLLKHPAFW